MTLGEMAPIQTNRLSKRAEPSLHVSRATFKETIDKVTMVGVGGSIVSVCGTHQLSQTKNLKNSKRRPLHADASSSG